MLERVYERVSMARYLSKVVIATDDERIFAEARRFRAHVTMTRSDHLSGTDRVAEVASAHPESGLIVNVQGEYIRAQVLFEESLKILRGLGNKDDIARALFRSAWPPRSLLAWRCASQSLPALWARSTATKPSSA